MILASLVLLALAAAWVRVFWIVPAFHKRKGRICSKNGRGRLLIFLGSGGHTAEMLALLTNLPSRYADRLWLYSVGDNLSKEKVADWERRQFTKAISNTVVGIPRARMVGQYWILTPFTFLASLVLAALPVMRFDADILLINGPGTAVVIVTIIYILKFFGNSQTRIIYVESFARVNTLSLSGRVLLPFVDRLIVQWPQLVDKYPRVEYLGVVV